MRLIDADELLEKLGLCSNCLKCRWDSIGCADRYEHTVMRICSDIEDTPTIDAVVVVRCKDCKYFSKVCSCDKTVTFVDEDFYCADGERRTE